MQSAQETDEQNITVNPAPSKEIISTADVPIIQSTQQTAPKIDLKQEITVVIPVLNEELGVSQVIDRLKALGYESILVIDGYSEDNTVNVCKAKNVPVILQNGSGKAGAIRTALDYMSTPYLLLIDGDATYNPGDIERFLQHMKHFDEIIGARMDQSGNISLLNRFGNWMINTTFKMLFSQPIRDVCSGMYLLRTSFAKGIQIETGSFDVEVEIASQAASKGRITEVPIHYGKRIGKTKLRPVQDGLRIIRTIMWMAHYYNPALLYTALVSLAAIPAIGILIWCAYEGMVLNSWHTGYALFGVMLLLLASQAAAVGLISLLIKRMEHRVKELIRPNL